ncbi:phosphoribosylaminoimidazolesuccinocarboxamide synthase [Candidatus Parcubacteria bacterium]|nr:phosphoribosylaminoimidazolesuccinocarboxamide synthase [Candidatus Parcubacteria bacterium]
MDKLSNTLSRTNFKFPGQTGVYHGKVRDVYTFENERVVIVATDRISAFDVVMPKQIPFKGQVLNQLAAHFLTATSDIVPNWFQAAIDPNASAGLYAEPVKVEWVIRSCLAGHAWREYKAGKRLICGVVLPEGMKEYDQFAEPILTPSTKAETGHDNDISEFEILNQKLVTPEEWQTLKIYIFKLFARGQEMAKDRGLVLADTKYEFGRLNGQLILIDEVHTPDSSRYFYRDGYETYIAGKSETKPVHLSKEFVREWLVAHGFSGKSGQDIPELTDEFLMRISERYIKLYEEMTGEKFIKAPADNIEARIENSVNKYLKEKTNAAV